MKKVLKRSLLVLLLLAVTVLAGGSWYMLDFALLPGEMHGRDVQGSYNTVLEENPELRPWLDSLMQHRALHDTTVLMRPGERHHALYARAPKPTDRVAVLVHGYKDSAVGMLHIAHIYALMGYNVLLPDLHAHGRSEGKAVEMGWNERLDVLRWLAVANRLFADSTGTTRQVVHGISMGAATVMGVSGEAVPPYVKCYVEDCGYTSVWDEFSCQLRDMFGLPEFPLLYTTSALCRVRYGWSFGQASPLRQVSRCHRPMLFIHGDADTYVPYAMLRRLYDAKPQPKQLWIGRGSAHARSYQDHRSEYSQVVAGFVERYIKP